MNRIILITILAFFPKFVFAEHITPAQLLERYKANRNALRRHIVKGEDLQATRDTASGDEYKYWILSIFEFRTDVERIDLITNKYFNLQNPEDKSSAEHSSTTRQIWDGEKWINCSYKMMPGVSRASMSKREKKKRDLLTHGYEGSSLDGIFAGDLQPIDLILHQASDIAVRPEMETVNGTNCYVIDATTPNGKYNLWIDPEHGYNIAKAKGHKTSSDILYDKPISQHKPPRVREGFRYDGILPGKRSEYFFWFDIIEFKKIGSVWVPVEAIGQMENRYVDGRIISGKHHHKRTHIDLNPDFEAIGAFVPDFPEGAKIYLEWVPGIRYTWRDGKLVPDIDKYVIDKIDKMTEEITSEGEVPAGLVTAKKTEAAPNLPAGIAETQATTEEAQGEILSESRSFPMLVFVLIGLSIIAIIAWRVLL